jgi:hypothetical protein
MRATRRHARASRRGTSRTMTFVAAILARHARGIASVFGLDRTTRRLSPVQTAVNRHLRQGDRTNFFLRFDIRLAPAVRVRAAPQPLLRWEPSSAVASAPPPTPSATRFSLVERIVARERRVETSMTIREALRDVTTPRHTGGAAAVWGEPPPAPPRTRPVEMVVHRRHEPAPTGARVAPPDPAPAEASERAPRPNVFIRAMAPTPTVLSQAEIGRVTDQVVRAIDRRLVAQRERRGKI